jgi:hypothetical protein
MSDGGKGDKRRPEDQEKWDDGYTRIFGKKSKPAEDLKEEKEINED